MVKNLRILFADNLHINERNFPSLHRFIEKSGAETYYNTERKDIIAAYGNYVGRREQLAKIKFLKKLSCDELFKWEVDGINLFHICRSEMLSFLLPQPQWQLKPLPKTEKELFQLIWKQEPDILMANMAVAWDWIEHWIVKLDDLPLISHACIFSGSLIYQRSLVELLQSTSTKVMMMESSFTGNDYYCEEKYGPIANNSDIKFDTVYNSYKVEDDATLYDRERNKAVNKILMANNKNVIQPIDFETLEPPNKNRNVLIIGQVMNDFSLIESGEVGIASIPFYKELIEALASRDIGVIFKAHPWEEKKTNVEGKVTMSALERFVDEMPQDYQKNVLLTDHYPIDRLFEMADHVMGLNSQALIEAAFHGHKPVQFGNAFFGRRGFTYDQILDDVNDVAAKVKMNSLAEKLSVSEFQKLEEFLVKYLQQHLISVHQSGISTLQKRFSGVGNIPLASQILPTPSKKMIKNEPQLEISILSPLQRKRKKLANDPFAFFRDSSNPVIRPIRHLFKGP